jgi:capsular exopolysaccharide synthesis family protein
MVGSGDQQNVLMEIARLESTLRDTGNRMAVLKGQRAAIEAAMAKLPAEQVTRMVTRNPRLDDLKTKIADLETTRAAMVLEFKPAHPKVAALDTQLASLRARLAAEPEEKVAVTRTNNPTFATKRAQLEANETELEGLRAQYRRQDAQLANRRREYLNQGAQAVQLAQLERVRNSAEKSYQVLTDKLQDLRIREEARRSMARVIEPAVAPRSPVRPRKAMNVLLACMVGLCLGVSMAFLQEFMDDRINSPEDIERLVDLPVMGHIPTFTHAEQRLITQLPSHSPITESYRGLRTSIGFSGLDAPIRTLIVSSAHQGEGKSHTAANLAIAMALDGRRGILVDTDLRRPNVHLLLEMPQSPGLSEVLIGQKTLVEALQPGAVDGLQVITSGAMPPNPAELLSSAAMQRLIEVLRDEADVVIFNTPPCIPVTDATVLSARVDGVLLVVRMGEARKAAVRLARNSFTQARARILGLVLNRVDHAGASGYYYYDYRRGYGDDGPKPGGAEVLGARCSVLGSGPTAFVEPEPSTEHRAPSTSAPPGTRCGDDD